MVAGRAALETLKSVLAQIHREYRAGFFRAVNRTRAATLLAGALSRLKAEEFQDFRHGDERAYLAKVDSGQVVLFEQRRGTRRIDARKHFTGLPPAKHAYAG